MQPRKGIEASTLQVGTVLESYEDADIPFFWFHSIGQAWVRFYTSPRL